MEFTVSHPATTPLASSEWEQCLREHFRQMEQLITAWFESRCVGGESGDLPSQGSTTSMAAVGAAVTSAFAGYSGSGSTSTTLAAASVYDVYSGDDIFHHDCDPIYEHCDDNVDELAAPTPNLYNTVADPLVHIKAGAEAAVAVDADNDMGPQQLAMEFTSPGYNENASPALHALFPVASIDAETSNNNLPISNSTSSPASRHQASSTSTSTEAHIFTPTAAAALSNSGGQRHQLLLAHKVFDISPQPGNTFSAPVPIYTIAKELYRYTYGAAAMSSAMEIVPGSCVNSMPTKYSMMGPLHVDIYSRNLLGIDLNPHTMSMNFDRLHVLSMECVVRQPWPPPLLFVIWHDNVLIRPLPWPSFVLTASCSLSWRVNLVWQIPVSLHARQNIRFEWMLLFRSNFSQCMNCCFEMRDSSPFGEVLLVEVSAKLLQAIGILANFSGNILSPMIWLFFTSSVIMNQMCDIDANSGYGTAAAFNLSSGCSMGWDVNLDMQPLWALQFGQHINVDSAANFVPISVPTRVSIVEFEWTSQQKCDGHIFLLFEGCQLEIILEYLVYQGSASIVSDVIDSYNVWLQQSQCFWFAIIGTLCGSHLQNYSSYELQIKHWKFFERRIHKPWDPGISCFQDGILGSRISWLSANITAELLVSVGLHSKADHLDIQNKRESYHWVNLLFPVGLIHDRNTAWMCLQNWKTSIQLMLWDHDGFLTFLNCILVTIGYLISLSRKQIAHSLIRARTCSASRLFSAQSSTKYGHGDFPFDVQCSLVPSFLIITNATLRSQLWSQASITGTQSQQHIFQMISTVWVSSGLRKIFKGISLWSLCGFLWDPSCDNNSGLGASRISRRRECQEPSYGCAVMAQYLAQVPTLSVVLSYKRNIAGGLGNQSIIIRNNYPLPGQDEVVLSCRSR